VNCSGHFYDGKRQKYQFRLKNISAVGMSITTDYDFSQTHILSIHFESAGMQLHHVRQLKGEVIRKTLDRTGYHYSIRFVGVTNADIVELDEFLRYAHSNTFNTSIMSYENNDRMLT
jgi:hypothetical protein